MTEETNETDTISNLFGTRLISPNRLSEISLKISFIIFCYTL